MSAPPTYVIFQDYNTYQASHQLPGPALQGSDLNVEFVRIKASLDALINNLGLLQRSDGALNNQSVTPDTINSALSILIAGWNIRGAWVTSTSYLVKDYATNGGNGYVCIVPHTSGTFATDLAAGKWALVATAGATGTQGMTGATGATGPAGPTLIPRGHIGGLTLSNDITTPNTKLDVSAGQCADDTNVAVMGLVAGVIDCTTVGANGLDAGVLVLSTWYHVYAIGKVDGTTGLLASTTPISPLMPSGYTLKRRIGSFLTDSSVHIIAFKQFGDRFEWLSPVLDINVTSAGTSAVTRTLTVPTGLVFEVFLSVTLDSDGNGETVYLSALSQTDVASGGATSQFGLTVTGTLTAQQGMGFVAGVFTNSSAQIRSRQSFGAAAQRLRLKTHGWVDRRGRDD